MGTKNYLSSILNCTTAISQECFDFEILDQTWNEGIIQLPLYQDFSLKNTKRK